jgi:beta-glucosidase-like glycosyl hydrolase
VRKATISRLAAASTLRAIRETAGCFEYPGEDPLLAGVMVGHVIRGVQDNHIMGDIKHFALNDQETGRTVVVSESPKRPRARAIFWPLNSASGSGNPPRSCAATTR